MTSQKLVMRPVTAGEIAVLEAAHQWQQATAAYHAFAEFPTYGLVGLNDAEFDADYVEAERLMDAQRDARTALDNACMRLAGDVDAPADAPNVEQAVFQRICARNSERYNREVAQREVHTRVADAMAAGTDRFAILEDMRDLGSLVMIPGPAGEMMASSREVDHSVTEWVEYDRIIGADVARAIADSWKSSGNVGSVLATFACGMSVSYANMRRDITATVDDMHANRTYRPESANELAALHAYALHAATIEPTPAQVRAALEAATAAGTMAVWKPGTVLDF
jgi:hypothetical protein